jgi:hypothetical protein
MHSTVPSYLPAVLLTIVARQPPSVESVVMSCMGSARDASLPLGFPLPRRLLSASLEAAESARIAQSLRTEEKNSESYSDRDGQVVGSADGRKCEVSFACKVGEFAEGMAWRSFGLRQRASYRIVEPPR